MKSDLTIVGFGIIGAMIANTLSDYINDITIIYKYNDKKSASYHFPCICGMIYIRIILCLIQR